MTILKNCPICGSRVLKRCKERNYPTTEGLFLDKKIIECRFCKSAWVSNPPPELELDLYYTKGRFWEEMENQHKINEIYYAQAVARWDYILKIAPDTARLNNVRVLDWGAGHGCMLEIGRQFGICLQYTAVEMDQQMRKRIESIGGVALPKLQKEGINKCNLIILSHILEHSANPGDFLKKMINFLTPEGLVFIEVPCRDDEYKLDAKPHLIFFSPKGIKCLIERCGLDIIDIRCVGMGRSRLKYKKRVIKFKQLIPKHLKKIVKKIMGLQPQTEMVSVHKEDLQAPEDMKSLDFYRQCNSALHYQIFNYRKNGRWIRALVKTKVT